MAKYNQAGGPRVTRPPWWAHPKITGNPGEAGSRKSKWRASAAAPPEAGHRSLIVVSLFVPGDGVAGTQSVNAPSAHVESRRSRRPCTCLRRLPGHERAALTGANVPR